MVILYPTSMFPKLSETFILEQITGLIDLGHKVKVVAFYQPDEMIFHPQIEKYDLLAKTLYIPKLEKEPGFKFTPEVLEFLADVDVIHAHFAALPADFAMHASNVLGIPYVFTTHAYDIFVHTSAQRLSEYASSARRIITVSDFNKRYMLDMIGEQYGDKIDIIRCGIDVNRFSPNDRPLQSPVTLLATGRFVEKKGITYAIRAMARLPEQSGAVLRIIGDGPLRGEIEGLVAQLGLGGEVTLLGGLPQSEVIREMQLADIFVLPSVTASNNDREGLPVSILEAQAMRLPVVSTIHTGIPEGVIDGETGFLVPERDEAALADKLSILIQSSELRREMGEAGRRHVEATFSIAQEILKLEKILFEAVNATSRPMAANSGSKIRVLFVSHSPYFFGAEQSFFALLENLDRTIIEPIVILPAMLPDGTLAKQLKQIHIQTHVLDSPKRWIDFPANCDPVDGMLEELSTVEEYCRIIREENIELVYTNTITKISAAIAAKLCGKPHVYHVREVLKDHPLQSLFTPETTFRIIDYLSNHIITNSRFVIEQFQHVTPSHKISHVYNAIDISSFSIGNGKHLLRQELGIDESAPLVAIIGSIHRHKNHEDVINAIAILKDSGTEAVLAVIGHPFPDYYDELLLQIKSLQVEERVFFLPFRSDIEQLLPDIDILVIASLAEPFGRTTIEAMAAAKPVVATNTGASPEIVIDGVTGFLVPVGKPDAMAGAISRLISDPIMAKQMGLAGRERVRKVFNLDTYATSITRILTKVATTSPSPDRLTATETVSALKVAIPPKEFEAFTERVTACVKSPTSPYPSASNTLAAEFITQIIRSCEGRMTSTQDNTAPKTRARLISFYLPQFHPIPENDAWWGKGFTEWTNVAKATPLFPGHHQPHIPSELGFYDLRLPDTRKAQADLAREHGIEAFCYWHYWFHGKRLIERPFTEVLRSGEPTFSFCLAWANETWSRRWLGEEKDILMQQSYSPEDDLNHVRWLLPAFADPRCLKVNGRPLFLIYRPTDLPDPRRTTDVFRAECVRSGLPEPYLLGINSHCLSLDCRTIGFDGTVHFMPQLGNLPEFMSDAPSETKRARNLRLGIESDKLKIYDYHESVVAMRSARQKYSHPVHPSLFVGWDNTPRRGENGIIVVNSSPTIFGKHLEEMIQEVQCNDPDERLLFLNAWNEWAEGNHLEPDTVNGRSYLEEVKRINPPCPQTEEKLISALPSTSIGTDKSTPAAQTAKAIAFFLPQYHPISENDEWWGKGFTEWSNVTKAQPQFPGHYQPHLPSELGYYDLRLPEVRKAQAELAREHGLHGFCYYHYWFGGKLLLEKPLHDMLDSREPDFPFCLCWANEPWTRAWDGRTGHVLAEQHYSEEDDRKHIRYLSQFFQDPRYIRVDGKPLFLIYRANHMPDPARAAEVMRDEARKIGIGEIYLCRVESFTNEHTDPDAIGFDASVEFQPDWTRIGKKSTNPVYGDHNVHDYEEMANRMMAKKRPPYKRFPCVTPAWDNASRRKTHATIFVNSTPKLYEKWLTHAVNRCGIDNPDDRIVFINAWNEWGEGCHLEPDQVHGRAYLEATRNALYKASEAITEEVEKAHPHQIIQGQAEYDRKLAKRDLVIAEHERLLAAKEALLADLNRLLAEKDQSLEEHEKQILEREQRIQDLLNSASWQVTKPLRKGYELLRLVNRRK